MAATVLTACSHTLEESCFNEFELQMSDGTIRKGGVYLPVGYNPRKEYPVIYMEDGLVFKECQYGRLIDSLMEAGSIRPVVIACSYENKLKVPGKNVSYRNAEFLETLAKSDTTYMKLFNAHLKYFRDVFILYIEHNYAVSHAREDRVFYGTSNSADWGLTFSMKYPDMMAEYWCFSPVASDLGSYGMLPEPVQYRIYWGAKEETGHFDYFSALTNSVRKRGGKVESMAFNGGHDREWWKYLFGLELERRFPAKNNQ